MCECHAAEAEQIKALKIHKAEAIARSLLSKSFGITVNKALIDISTRSGFDEAVAGMALSLASSSAGEEQRAIQAALRVLKIDWSKTTAEMRRNLVNDAMEAARKHTALIPKAIKKTLDVSAKDVIDSTRNHLRRTHKLTIGAEWNAVDKRIAKHITGSVGNFVTDEYGRRVDSFGEEARTIVDAAVEQGLGREEVSKQLQQAAKGKISGRSPFYWDVIAGSFVGRGRSYAQMSGYAEAGVESYQIVAMMDERTSQICRALDGKIFSVAGALSAFEQQEAVEKPEDIKKVAPWARVARDKETGKEIIYVEHTTGRRAVAMVERSGVGARDDAGEFSRMRSPAELQRLGLGFPPYHGLCRTTTVPA